MRAQFLILVLSLAIVRSSSDIDRQDDPDRASKKESLAVLDFLPFEYNCTKGTGQVFVWKECNQCSCPRHPSEIMECSHMICADRAPCRDAETKEDPEKGTCLCRNNFWWCYDPYHPLN